MDPLVARLVGLWRAVPDWKGGMVTYLRFLEDLRLIAIFTSYVQIRNFPMKWLWQTWRGGIELEPNSVVRCHHESGGSSWTRIYYFEGERLVIATTIQETEGPPTLGWKLYHCDRIAVQDLPEGVEAEFDKAMARPWL
jgi:hypothetical protein